MQPHGRDTEPLLHIWVEDRDQESIKVPMGVKIG